MKQKLLSDWRIGVRPARERPVAASGKAMDVLAIVALILFPLVVFLLARRKDEDETRGQGAAALFIVVTRDSSTSMFSGNQVISFFTAEDARAYARSFNERRTGVREFAVIPADIVPDCPSLTDTHHYGLGQLPSWTPELVSRVSIGPVEKVQR